MIISYTFAHFGFRGIIPCALFTYYLHAVFFLCRLCVKIHRIYSQFTKNKQNARKPFRNSEQRKKTTFFENEKREWSKNKLIPRPSKVK